jgi:hypothetical protein
MDLYGEIDGFAEEALAAYDEAEMGDPEVVLLNFGSVGYINSTGIALIVGLLAKARLQAAPAGLRPLQALRGDLSHAWTTPPTTRSRKPSGRRRRRE